MMRDFKLEEVSEMVFDYMQDNQTNLLTAYDEVNKILVDKNTYSFEEVKHYLFHHCK